MFALNLDPDGTTFWTGDDQTGTVYHVDIATGAIITSFTSNPITGLSDSPLWASCGQRWTTRRPRVS